MVRLLAPAIDLSEFAPDVAARLVDRLVPVYAGAEYHVVWRMTVAALFAAVHRSSQGIAVGSDREVVFRRCMMRLLAFSTSRHGCGGVGRGSRSNRSGVGGRSSRPRGSGWPTPGLHRGGRARRRHRVRQVEPRKAIAGEEVALTGGIRPMTSEPLALVPADGAEALDGFLDELGISDRVEHDGPSWLCLIDLPDNDSVELDHRHRVDVLLPRVDMVAWVTDPNIGTQCSITNTSRRCLAIRSNSSSC